MSVQGQIVAGFREGDLLAGKYRIERVLGAGGMGIVVAARHIHLDDRVAIKLLLPEMLANTDAVQRFGREARAAVKIKSEHVARVSDVGTLETGAPYMVMEYLDGSDLSNWLLERGAMPIEQAVEFVLQAGEAIAEAHTLGIVHRDLKPANLFVVRRADGTLSVKVLDFGISKMANTTGFDMTKTSAIMGSPLYMSPEQMHSSKDVDPRSDLWALGVILYELLSGDSPFQGNTMPELVARILSAPPEPLRKLRPDAPPALEAAILRCLQRDREARFQSVAELASALMPFAPARARVSVERIYGILKAAGFSPGSVTLTHLNADATPARPAGARTATAASWGRTDSKPNSGKAKLGIVAIVVAVVGLGGALALKRIARSPDSSASNAATAPLPEHAVTPEPKATATATAVPQPTAPAVPQPTATPAPAVESAPPASNQAITPSPTAAHPAGHPVVAHRPASSPKHPAASSKPEAPAASPPPAPAAPPAAPKPATPKPDSIFDDRQ